MYPVGVYKTPPQQSQLAFPAHRTPAPNKEPFTNNVTIATYDHSNQQQHHHIAKQHQVAPSAPSAGEPPSFSSTHTANQYGTVPATFPGSAPPPPTGNAHGDPQSLQQPLPNGTPLYGGQQQYHASQTQQQHQHRPSMAPAPQSCPGAPVHPIVSYPSAPGSSRYGALNASKTTVARTIPNLMNTPLHGRVASIGASSGIATSPSAQTAAAAAAVPSSPSSDDAGVTSSATTSAPWTPNSYDSLERVGYPDSMPPSRGVGYPDSMPPSRGMAGQAPPYSNHGYQDMQVTYRQHPVSRVDSPPSFGGYGQSSIAPQQQHSQPFPNLSQSSVSSDVLRPVNLQRERNLLPPRPLEAPEPNLSPELKAVNCSPQTFRCTLTGVPQTPALLSEAGLPLGLLLQPFRDDVERVPAIASNTIVRCLSCLAYLNPFVSFLDERRWKCNVCGRVNCVQDEVVDEHNPETGSAYGELRRRPEARSSTVEFIATPGFVPRPPQPAVYLFVLDVSHNAAEVGYLKHVCDSLLENLDRLPGDTRTRVGFVTFDSAVHFYHFREGASRPQMLVVSDCIDDDVFVPSHGGHLVVNLKESEELVRDLLRSLPSTFARNGETRSALGPALQAAYRLMRPTGGRVSVFQTQLPTLGAGGLRIREQGSDGGVQHLGPATDFYKNLALDCSSQQICVDLFLLSSQYADLASLACVARYSAGSVFYYPSFHHVQNAVQLERFRKDVARYLTRAIGFEADLRVRCTGGLSVHTFHGNCFVRSTDRLSLANVNPDSALAVQVSMDDGLADYSRACFQAALLYTCSRGTRRIRVHTLCLPVVSTLSDVYAGADVQAVACLLANMAVERSVSHGLPAARDGLVNAVVGFLDAYRGSASNTTTTTQQQQQQAGLVAPASLRLFPLYVLALLKQNALRGAAAAGSSSGGTRLDERVFAMCELKTQPLQQTMRTVHPDLYRLDDVVSDQEGAMLLRPDGGGGDGGAVVVPQPRLQRLSSEWLSRDGAFLMDRGDAFYLWVGKCCGETFIRDVLGCPDYASVNAAAMNHLPALGTPLSAGVRAFLGALQERRAFSAAFHVVKDGVASSAKTAFLRHLVEDRSEAAFSYLEFLQHIEQKMSK